jgi:hypothetical protein
MSTRAFNVYLGRKKIDRVFYKVRPREKLSADDVRRSLIEYDGYDPDIRVHRIARRGS